MHWLAASRKQKQKMYDEAAAHFENSLRLRRGTEIVGGKSAAERAKEREQAIAQSLVSLGNLAIERGDAAANDSGVRTEASHEQKAAYYSEARGYLEAAVEAYVRGLRRMHICSNCIHAPHRIAACVFCMTSRPTRRVHVNVHVRRCEASTSTTQR